MHVAAWRLGVPLSTGVARVAAVRANSAGAARVAAVRAIGAGLLAVVDLGDAPFVVAGAPRRGGAWHVSDAPLDILALVQRAGTRELAFSPSDEARAREGIQRWMRNRLARASSEAGPPASGARRNVLQRADAILATAPAHRRSQLGERLVNLRRQLATAVSAGAEMLVLDLAHDRSGSGEEWLDECERLLARAAPATKRVPEASSGGILALLLLIPRPSGRSLLQRRAPRAAST
jgi:hypothetical protein